MKRVCNIFYLKCLNCEVFKVCLKYLFYNVNSVIIRENFSMDDGIFVYFLYFGYFNDIFLNKCVV